MRFAIVSDLHLGDELCSLVARDASGEPRLGPGYEVLRDGLRRVAPPGEPLDYLVLLGDILDFSVGSHPEIYSCAQTFFRQLSLDGLARELLYVPGNHDFDIWGIVEHEVNVRIQVESGQAPRDYAQSVPGVIDFRPRAEHPEGASLYLHGVKHVRQDVPQRGYGGLFLNHIVGRGAPPLNFVFAYPNLYVVLDDEQSVLVTHGHYLEAYWSAGHELATFLSGTDPGAVPWEDPHDFPNVRELVGANFPLSQLACSGVGQAHPLSRFFYDVKRGVNRGDVATLSRHLARLDRHLAAGGLSKLRLTALGLAWNRALRWLLRALRDEHGARFDTRFLARPRVQRRFHDYYAATLREIRALNERGWQPGPIPPPTSVVFGHTHEPIGWDARATWTEAGGRPIRFCNTGGWVLAEDAAGGLSFPGAEIVWFDSTTGGAGSVAVPPEALAPSPAEARRALAR